MRNASIWSLLRQLCFLPDSNKKRTHAETGSDSSVALQFLVRKHPFGYTFGDKLGQLNFLKGSNKKRIHLETGLGSSVSFRLL